MEWDLEQLKQIGLWGVVAWAAFYYGKDLLPKLFKFLPSFKPAPEGVQDAAGKVLSLIEYFEGVGCKAGVDAARTCGACLFHQSHEDHKT